MEQNHHFPKWKRVQLFMDYQKGRVKGSREEVVQEDTDQENYTKIVLRQGHEEIVVKK